MTCLRMFEKVSFRPTDSERAYLEELYLRAGAKTMTEFWHMFLQDSMTQKGGTNSSPPSSSHDNMILPAKQDRVVHFQDYSSMVSPTAILLQAQREHYERQMQGMYQQIQNLGSEVTYLRQQMQYFAVPSGGLQFTYQQQQMPQQTYVPWSFNPTSNYPYSYYPSQAPYYQTEPPPKDFWDTMTENFEKMVKFRNAINGYRSLV